MPAVERLRGIDLLGREDRFAGQLQRVTVSSVILIERTEIAPGIGRRPPIARVLGHAHRFGERPRGLQQEAVTVGRERGTQVAVGQTETDQQESGVVRRAQQPDLI